jgi:hypothetical protein
VDVDAEFDAGNLTAAVEGLRFDVNSTFDKEFDVGWNLKFSYKMSDHFRVGRPQGIEW